MPKTTTQPLTQTITTFAQTIVNATGAIAATGSLNAPVNTLVLTTAGAEGSIVKRLTITSDNTANSTIQVWLSKGGPPYTTKFPIGTVVVSALAGQGTLSNSDFLGNVLITGLSFDQMGKPVLMLGAGESLHVGILTTAVASGRAVYVTGEQEDY